MKVKAQNITGSISFAFSHTDLDRVHDVTIPANLDYYATCGFYDEQAGANISYTVEIDIEDRAIIDPNQQVNYFLFSNGNVGPQKTALIKRIGAPRTITVRVAEWPDRNRYDSYVNRTDQIAPPDDSYINFDFGDVRLDKPHRNCDI
jgi:hypothetical protein